MHHNSSNTRSRLERFADALEAQGHLSEPNGLGALIKAARHQACLTQGELAEELRFPTSVIGRLECGNITPGWRTMARIADSCGLRLQIGFRREERAGQQETRPTDRPG